MNLATARKLRDEIRSRGIHCVVPLGQPTDDYYAAITISTGRGKAELLAFFSREEWLEYRIAYLEKELELAKAALAPMFQRPRHPIEALIDQACGVRDSKGK